MPPNPDPTADPSRRAPLAAGIACFSLWGLFPLFFQAVGAAGAGAWEVVGWRVLAGVPIAALLVAISGQGPACRALLRQPRTIRLLAVSGLLVGVNWGVFIWAVQHGQVLAASLGYYLNPLFNVAFGAVLFGERLRPPALAAIGLAALGVALQAWAIQGLPWVALALALSFSLYGVIRKHAPVEAQTGLLVETLVLSLPSAAFLAWAAAHGAGAFGTSPAATAWLLACGPATVAPLVAFAYAARRLPLSTLGFLQFIQPTMAFAIGAWQGEPVSALRLASFALIWTGVAIFAAGAFRPGIRP